jgi:transcriptional regulator with XRE-family HTH domain
MRAGKSHLTPARVFGARVRELRQRRGLSQGELADRLHLHRTTVNKIESGALGDVSISQLFAFAEGLGTSPIYLLTPGDEGPDLELTTGGRVVDANAARDWIRGSPPPETDALEFFLDLPRSEQRLWLRRIFQQRQDASSAGDPVQGAMNRLFHGTPEADALMAEAIDESLKRLEEAAAANRPATTQHGKRKKGGRQ